MNNPTVQAKQVWRYVYGEPWPKGWKVKWVAVLERRRIGSCHYGLRTIRLQYLAHANPRHRDIGVVRSIYLGGAEDDAGKRGEGEVAYAWQDYGPEIQTFTWDREYYTYSVLDTLIHEFTHLRNKGLRHGVEFERLVSWGMDKLGLPRHFV